MFSDWRQLPAATDALQAAGWVWRAIITWDKGNSGRPAKSRFRANSEFVIWDTNGPYAETKMNPVGSSVISVSPVRGAARRHPTEKPETLIGHLLDTVSHGGMVLDPFAGCGTVGAVALSRGLRSISVEIAPRFVAVIADRFAQQALPL